MLHRSSLLTLMGLLCVGCFNPGDAPGGGEGLDSGESEGPGTTSNDGGLTSEGTASGGGESSSGTDSSSLQAEPDTFRFVQDQAVELPVAEGVLANDERGSGPVQVALDQPSNVGASVELRADGSLKYTPLAAWWGEDRFSYVITDGAGHSSGAEVRIVVHPTTIPLARIEGDGIGGFAIRGHELGANAGRSVCIVADMTGDGLDEVVVGADEATPHGASSGRAYVVFGREETAPVSLLDIALGRDGFVVDGVQADDRVGRVVRTAGDVNGDGAGDLLLAAGTPAISNDGRAYVVFGKTSGDPVSLANLDVEGDGGFAITRTPYGIGSTLDTLGDINGDGLDDLVLGASHESNCYGSCYSFGGGAIVFGQDSSEPIAIGFSGPSEAQGTAIGGTGTPISGNPGFVSNDNFMGALSGAGDLNGDGLGDIVVGADQTGDGDAGRVYVILGADDLSEDIVVQDIAAGNGGSRIDGNIDGQHLGRSVSGAGDVNGDGLDDVIFSAAFDVEADVGRAFVAFGRESTDPLPLSAVDGGAAGFAIAGTIAGEHAGLVVAGVGDVNHDGFDDVAVVSTPSESTSRVYVVFGRTEAQTIDLEEVAQGQGGFAVEGPVEMSLETPSVAGAGDVNGDGFDDIVIGALNGFTPGTAGISFVVFGGDFLGVPPPG